MRILLQGDSITDAWRDYENPHDMGQGYAKFATEALRKLRPEVEFEFINLGISGNQTKDLEARLQTDFIDIQPDIVSILVGVNDVWHYAEGRKWLSHEIFERQYRAVLEGIKTKTNAKIVMMEPFLIPIEDKLYFREDLDPKIQIVRKLAREYADVYIPLDGLLVAETLGKNPLDYVGDGVHPNPLGAQFIGEVYAQWIAPLVDRVEKKE